MNGNHIRRIPKRICVHFRARGHIRGRVSERRGAGLAGWLRPDRAFRLSWQWLRHPWLALRCQIALGAVFVIAALPKLGDPPAFAKLLWNYQLCPPWSIHPAALVLPWLELICGLALCIGIWVRAAAGWLAVLLLAFVLALSINLARNHPVDCGCFQVGEVVRTDAERLSDMKWNILRDLGLMLLAAQVLLAPDRRRTT